MKRKPRRDECSSCGRRIIVFYRGKAFLPLDDEHDLCGKCWKAERDKHRNIADTERLSPE